MTHGPLLRRAFVALCIAATAPALAVPGPACRPEQTPSAGALAQYGHLPMHFEANVGQADPAVRFSARGHGYQVFLTSNEAVLVLQKAGAEERSVMRLGFSGASEGAAIEGESSLPGKTYYFGGERRARWEATNYARVRYRGLYPGIDLVLYGNQRALEYDWVIAPGADPHRIVQVYEGATRLRMDARGDLQLETAGGVVSQPRPHIYQDVDGSRVDIEGGYVVLGANTVGYELGAYDASRPLVIDPTLQYSTLIGGISSDIATAVAASPAGEVFVAGRTLSNDFPQPVVTTFPNGRFTPFVTKLNAAGNAIVYSALFSVGQFDSGVVGIKLQNDGSLYFAGSADFGFAGQRVINPGGVNTFSPYLAHLSADGSTILDATLIGTGRNGGIGVSGFAMDATGAAYFYGTTNNSDFPTTSGAFLGSNPNNANLLYLMKVPPTGASLAYATLLGDASVTTNSTFPNGMGIDSAGNAVLTGFTVNPAGLGGAAGGIVNGTPGTGGFAIKINAAGSGAIFTSYFPSANPIAVETDDEGSTYLVGDGPFPSSAPIPGTGVPPTTFFASIAKLDATGAVVSATPIASASAAANSSGRAFGVVRDRIGQVYVTGFVNSPFFPLAGDFGLGGTAIDMFVAKLSPDLGSLLFSSKIGGGGEEIGFGIALDGQGGVYAAGRTGSGGFPQVGGLGRPFKGGGFDAFVLKISDPLPPLVLFSSKNPVSFPAPVTFTAIVTTPGATGSVAFSDGSTPLGTAAVDAAGRARVTASLSPGSHTITASYSGDATHAAASATLVQLVNAVAKDSVTTLTASTTSMPANQSVVLTAVVTGINNATPTGSVTFIDGARTASASLVGGTAQTTFANLAPGDHSITAQYGGDVLNRPSVSAPVLVHVFGPPAVSITAPANPTVVEYPATVTVTAAASPAPEATLTTVELLRDGTPVATFTAPPYTFSFANAPPGVYRFTLRATDNFGQVAVSDVVQVQIHLQGTTYYHHDLLGSVIATTDSFGTVVYTESYQPYGGRLVGDPAGQVAQDNGNRLWFHGKAQDESTGLQYFGARYYDPAIGRFMGIDKVGVDPNDLHTFNRYAYGKNNPYRYFDPDGRMTLPAIVLTAGVIVVGAAWVLCDSCKKSLAQAVRRIGNVMNSEAKDPNETPAAEPSSQSGGTSQGDAGAKGDDDRTGSYTNTHQSGKTYSGKGGKDRSQTSGREKEQEHGDPHVATDWTPAQNDREAFKDEARRIRENGGVKSDDNYNIRNSPGERYIQQDESGGNK